MKDAYKFLKTDYRVHLGFAGLAAVLLLLMPFTEGGSGVILLLLWPFLGLWQVVSALVLSVRFGDKIRSKYLLIVAAYFVVLFLMSFIDFGGIAGIWLLGSIPLAGWYAYQTYKDASYNPKSFWDLEF